MLSAAHLHVLAVDDEPTVRSALATGDSNRGRI